MRNKTSRSTMNINKGNYVIRKPKSKRPFKLIIASILIVGLATTVFAIQFKTQITQHAYFASDPGSCFLSASSLPNGGSVNNGQSISILWQASCNSSINAYNVYCTLINQSGQDVGNHQQITSQDNPIYNSSYDYNGTEGKYSLTASFSQATSLTPQCEVIAGYSGGEIVSKVISMSHLTCSNCHNAGSAPQINAQQSLIGHSFGTCAGQDSSHSVCTSLSSCPSSYPYVDSTSQACKSSPGVPRRCCLTFDPNKAANSLSGHNFGLCGGRSSGAVCTNLPSCPGSYPYQQYTDIKGPSAHSACGKGAPVANGTTVRCCTQTQ